MKPLLVATSLSMGERLAPLDLSLSAGTLTAAIGPNGSGKTSLLRSLARIDRPGGAVSIMDEDLDSVPPARRPALLGFLPAAREMIWPIAVRDLVGLGLAQPDERRVADLLRELELDELADRPADRLSTGERARALLARALAPRPAVLLLDEPLSNLDPYWVVTILQLLRDAAEAGAAVLLSLHDLHLLDTFDRVLMLNAGQLVEDGPPKQILHGPSLADTFRVEASGPRWRLRRA
ncbi:ABC transporter ATP-binding protein [Sphingomonas sp. BN140010]|uniref:ABC transporter ATP-binding protein n=1 Tax=Sphingomonas arvum TaxID=2992113 RepID=A0ABT3JEK9_9SPHN|nr:ABC transporter ATP-binding protein [Sphingomonas sp. BN140010]MCW3797476.1 ABC transporter ATP-binding protein [Sphingomonas sp. BN140010]